VTGRATTTAVGLGSILGGHDLTEHRWFSTPRHLVFLISGDPTP